MRLPTVLDPTQQSSEAEDFERELRRRIIGQDRPIRQLTRVYQAYLAGLSAPGRPLANLLLLGPTGSGKTRLVEATAEALFGDARAVVKIDCAEFQHGHEIAKLVGSPPGYLGHRETHPMITQEVLEQHYTEKVKLSLVLFDEIEKASDALWQLLLGILDKATLTLGDNQRVDFSRSLIFLTSNLGSQEMTKLMSGGLGYTGGPHEEDAALDQKIYRTALDAAQRKFSPEFMNRIDKGDRFPDAQARTPGEDPGHRAGTRAAKDHVLGSDPAVCIQLHAECSGLPAAGRHRLKIRSATPEALDRTPRSVSSVEPVGNRADRGRRSGHNRLRP
jgi:ATP-dependent Clp protease ATP-binding subunit ClpB